MSSEETDGPGSSSSSSNHRRSNMNEKIVPDSASNSERELDDIISTQSVTTSIFQFHKENGRTYHSYRAGTYHWPNDASERERLEYEHLILQHAFHYRLHYAPLANPQNVLDIGTGSGCWAIEMGDAFPDATIEGTDLSPIQPSAVPDNVQFIIDDAEEGDWVVPLDHYDFIHGRMLLGCFKDYKAVLKKAFQHTKPGGWMESKELHPVPCCDDGSMPADWPLLDWHTRANRAAVIIGRSLTIAPDLKKWYRDVGFVDVQERVINIPLGVWARDPELKALGTWWRENLLLGLQGFTMGYFTRIFSWSPSEVEVYLVNVRSSVMDRSVHAYHKLHVVYGRKPEIGEVSSYVPSKQNTSTPTSELLSKTKIPEVSEVADAPTDHSLHKTRTDEPAP